MPRIIGVDIPNDKPVWVSLGYLYGVGRPLALAICKKGGIDPNAKAGQLTEDQLSKVTSIIEADYVVEGQLRRQTQQNISRLKEIGSYRGMRHRRGLPCRGQRTKTNARTRKGPRKTVAGKKSVKEMR
jgi:small subunit ribosomal protein S13